MILAPLVRGRRGKQEDVAGQDPQSRASSACGSTAKLYDLEKLPEIDARREHCIEAVVDRIVVRSDSTPRLGESVRLAIRHGEGLLIACYQEPAVRGCRSAERSGWQERCSARCTPVRSATSAWRKSNRARSASTAPTARARVAKAWAAWSSSIRNWWCPIPSCPWPAARSRRGRGVKPDPLKKHRPQLAAFLEADGAAWRHAAASNCRPRCLQHVLARRRSERSRES